MKPRLELLHTPATGRARSRAPALLFLHGAFCGAWCWQEHFMPWFARQRFDCWALSLEGHGNSEGRAHLDALGINDYRRDLVSSLSQFQTPPVIIAHSMGGFVLQQLYGRVPLAGAALLASVPPLALLRPIPK